MNLTKKVESAEQRKNKREAIIDSIMSSGDAQNYLDISRQRLNVFVQEGKLTPIHKGVFLKDDIYAFKNAFDKAREQGTWLRDFK